ncbi:hypothetical protein EUA93_16810 [Nocardioides oleivorans]|uniref:Zn-dependent metalloprotease n=1 Tax=Nocardioides oleivorans TaxID=273676 RepID=A0A4Q2RT69_9ACTN|nr:M4 family metallopeptidase [Nocardioides oleivorans]RYB91796.1 hypothetical protein EUA93_16810 [Nocardioides oleivorans]
MTQHTKVAAALVAAVALAGGQLAWGSAQAAPEPTDPGLSRLTADATAGLRVERDAAGVVDFVGTAAGSSVVNPAVSSVSSVRDAARAHLDRYGSTLGLTDSSELVVSPTVHTVSGQDVVRFQQEVDGAPVIGGQVVVSLRPDRQLGSVLSTLSDVDVLPAASVTEADARTTALAAGAREAGTPGALHVIDEGRAVWDPTVFGAPTSLPVTGVWAFEVGDGEAVRRLVLVDDTSGRVIVDHDLVEHVDRVVCDRNNVRGTATACTSGFARIEGQAATSVVDVDKAYDYAGEVSTAYLQLAGLDLTQALGVDVAGQKKLAATVRFCYPTGQGACPYANAFWNGTQMFYGSGFAAADDVVGHEMTHGVIDQYSELLYWGQSGAINESIADIMGEVVDHRFGSDDDSQWKLAEDLALSTGPIRDMSDPTAKGDPDRMTSPLYTADLTGWSPYAYPDSGGVHSNSGVGNKTGYLISQGGTFNGRTIVGIDGVDTGLTKSGRLWFDVITRLTSGSDYADLAAVLEQSCADFVTSGVGGFTSADCGNVAQAVAATELRTTPANAPQPADAVRSCPAGTTLRELFDSETGTPASKFTASAGLWIYGRTSAGWGSNATSGKDSWFVPNATGSGATSLVAASDIALPSGQKSFLHFQQWRVFQWRPSPVLYADGGTVEVVAGGVAQDASGLPWTNGPQQVLQVWSPNTNPWAGMKAFGGDSFGWTASQVDLSSYAGQGVRPSFTSRVDSAGAFVGWWLDDITVYTCDVPTTPPPGTPTPGAPTPGTPTPSLPNPSTPTPGTPTPGTPTQAGSTTSLKVVTGRKVTVVATVRVGSAKGTGSVTFSVDGTTIRKTVVLTKGKANLTLSPKTVGRLGRGRHTVKASYPGSSSAKPSRTRTSFTLK